MVYRWQNGVIKLYYAGLVHAVKLLGRYQTANPSPGLLQKNWRPENEGCHTAFLFGWLHAGTALSVAANSSVELNAQLSTEHRGQTGIFYYCSTGHPS